MKKLIFSLASMAIMATGLSSCSNEDMPSANEKNLREVYFKAKINRAYSDTRVSKEIDENGLQNNWAIGDVIVVTDADGERLGQLRYAIPEGETEPMFYGKVYTSGEDGTLPIKLMYFGEAAKDQVATIYKRFDIDIANQKGTLEGLADYDFMSCDGEMEIVDGKSSGIYDIESRLSFGHYKLVFDSLLPQLENATVKVTGTNIYTGTTIDLTTTANVEIDKLTPAGGNGEITVSGINTGRNTDGAEFDLYLILFAHDNMQLTFSVSTGSENYQATLPARKYNPNKIFWGYDGTTEHGNNGRLVSMVREYRFTLKYDANGGVSGTKTSDSAKTYEMEHAFVIDAAAQPTREGYIFKGWADSADGDVRYNVGGNLKPVATRANPNKTIYAVWEENFSGGITAPGAGGTTYGN